MGSNINFPQFNSIHQMNNEMNNYNDCVIIIIMDMTIEYLKLYNNLIQLLDFEVLRSKKM